MKLIYNVLLINIIYIVKQTLQLDIFYHPSFIQTMESAQVKIMNTADKTYKTKCYVVTENDKTLDPIKEYNANIIFGKDDIHIVKDKQTIKNMTYYEYIVN